jgi:hypothetical protein
VRNNEETMRLFRTISILVLGCAALLPAQEATRGVDRAVAQVGHLGAPMPMHLAAGPRLLEGTATPAHPYRIEARHPKVGCAETAVCGELYYTYEGHNLRTSAGTTWQYGQMAGTTAAVGTYLALTNSAITPAEADTSLASEIVTNGLTRALATPTNASTTLAVPAAPTASVVGTTGATSYFYWVAACVQGICTTPSLASNNITTANATLSTTNYNKITFTGQNGAASYQAYRTTTSSAPSGTASVLVGGAASCDSSLNCTVLDQSNTLTSVTIPASNLTNYGKYTLVYTWTCTGSAQSAQAFGVLNASSSGTLIFEGTFTPVALNPGDTCQLTETVYF